MVVHPHIHCHRSRERKEEEKSCQSTGGHLCLCTKPRQLEEEHTENCPAGPRRGLSYFKITWQIKATLFSPFILYSVKFFNFMLCKTVLPVDLDSKSLLHPHCSTPTVGTAFQNSKIPCPVLLPPDSICKACTSALSSLASDWQQRHSAVQNTKQQQGSNHLFKGRVLWIFIFSVRAMSNYF